MKSLIVDFHAGCISTLASSLKAASCDVEIASFSAHNFVLAENGFRDLVLPNRKLMKLKRKLGLGRPLQKFYPVSHRNSVMGSRLVLPRRGSPTYDLAWVQFPPGLYRRVLASGIAKHVVVYVSHRMDLWLSNAKDRERFWEEFTADWLSKKISVVSSNRFDAEYIKYYTGMTPAVLEPRALYIQWKVPQIASRPEILLMPSGLPLASDGIREVLGISQEIAPLRTIYPRYSLEDLRAHGAAIFIPYSVYSITLVELIEMGTTLFIPSARWLIDNELLNDVQLFPLYADANQIREFHPDDVDFDGGGPNDPDREIRLKWSDHAYWKNKTNVHIWDTPEELGRLVSGFLKKSQLRDLPRNSELQEWRDLVSEISSGAFRVPDTP